MTRREFEPDCDSSSRMGDVHISTQISTGKLMARALAENANCFHAMALSRLLPHYSGSDFPLDIRPIRQLAVLRLATVSCVSPAGGGKHGNPS